MLPICEYLKMVSFTFFIFFYYILSYSPFNFYFYYCLYFKAASKPIIKSNTPNWSLGLVEYIVYNNTDFAKLWRQCRQCFLIWHFECLLNQWKYLYNLSYCYSLNIIFKWQKITTPSCNGNHRLHISISPWWPIFVSPRKLFWHKIDASNV